MNARTPSKILSPTQIRVLLENHRSWSFQPESGFTRTGTLPRAALGSWFQFLAQLREVERKQASWKSSSTVSLDAKSVDIEIGISSPKFDALTYAIWKIDTEIAVLRAIHGSID